MFQWLNIELTSDCNKACHFCGRAKSRKDGTLNKGYMDFELFSDIIDKYEGSVLQFNKDGEPLLYPSIGKIGKKCSHLITNIVTNGKLLWDKKEELEDFTTITVSVFEDDSEQFKNVEKFVTYCNRPKVYIKFLGDYENDEYRKLGLTTLKRSIHAPKGDIGYEQSQPPIPELGICLDFLFKPSINWEGNFSICNRYDPENKGVLGNVRDDSLEWLWNSELRKQWLNSHKQGLRNNVPLCNGCEFWGVAANG